MISYDGLFKTMKKRGVSQYALYKEYGVSKSSIYYLKHNRYVNTELIDKLCGILSCSPCDIIRFKDAGRIE